MQRARRLLAYIPGLGFLTVGVVLLTIQSVEADLSDEAAYVLSALGTLFVTIAGVAMGRVSGLHEARKVVAPMVKPAFRRTFSLYQAFGRYAQRLRQARQDLKTGEGSGGKVSVPTAIGVLDLLEAQVAEQLESSNDAAEEWVPVFPDEVAQLRQQAMERAEE